MQVITVETPSLGDRSYLVHDGEVALVVDPQRDVDRVLDAAEAAGVRITHVAETHVHNDYVSGGLVLARMTGSRCLHAADAGVRFDHRPLADGDTVAVGRLTVEAVHTPGHTPHHLSYLVRDRGADDGSDGADGPGGAAGGPPAVFTGGSLLYGAVGRTDLVAEELTDELSRAQFHSVRRLAARLPDDALIYPTHGFGSFCASTSSGQATDGTLGSEREANIAFTVDDEDAFVERLVSGLTAYPRYYAHMGPMNLAGAGPVDLSPPAPVDPVELARRIHRGDWVVDLRRRQMFAADHVAGTISFELGDSFTTYLGWLIPWGTPLTLLADTPDHVAEAQRQLVRIGIDRPIGATTGSPALWAEPSRRRSYPVIDFAGVVERLAIGSRGGGDERPEEVDVEMLADPVAEAVVGGVVLDVRRADERAGAAIEGSLHRPLDQLNGHQADLPEATLLVHCGTGFRASVAASLLDRGGHDVVLIDDDFANAEAAGLTVVRPGPGGDDRGAEPGTPSETSSTTAPATATTDERNQP